MRRLLWRNGRRYRLHRADLPGRPDLVFVRERVVVFCDGDFWHGRDLEARVAKLSRGHNASYWVAKVGRNVQRDQETDARLHETGWTVLRLWETDILKAPEEAEARVLRLLAARSSSR